MKYRPTPLNIFSTILIVSSVWELVANKGGAFGFGVLWVLIASGISIIGLLVDLIIQKVASNYFRLLGIETIVVLIAATLYSYSQRTKTFIVSESSAMNYVVIVYGVENQPKLTDKFLPWGYQIKVPENGIVLTSSVLESDLPQTRMVNYSGVELNTEHSRWGWIKFSEDQFECNGQNFRYRSWMLRQDFCCGYSRKDIDSLRVGLQGRLCDQLMPSR